MNHHLINRLNAVADKGFYSSQYEVCREAAAEIERLESLINFNNSKHMEVVNNYNVAVEENIRLNKEVVEYKEEVKEATHANDGLYKRNVALVMETNRLSELLRRATITHARFPEVNRKPEEVIRNDELRDHIAIAAMEGTLSAQGWHPEYIIPAGGGHVGGQRAADAAAEAAYKYADAMLKAREK